MTLNMAEEKLLDYNFVKILKKLLKNIKFQNINGPKRSIENRLKKNGGHFVYMLLPQSIFMIY